MAKCRSCNAPIEWALTENGKKMPLDRRPDPKGNIIKTGAVIDGLPEVHVIGFLDQLTGDETRYTAHFATCPLADVHRKTKAAKR